jgi:hypothetical protein
MTALDAAAADPADLGDLIEFMRTKAAEQGDNPAPLMQGTFALYPTPEGGVMMVAAVPAGPMEGIHHYHMPPALMRGISVLFGGNKVGAVKSMFKRKRTKELGS